MDSTYLMLFTCELRAFNILLYIIIFFLSNFHICLCRIFRVEFFSSVNLKFEFNMKNILIYFNYEFGVGFLIK